MVNPGSVVVVALWAVPFPPCLRGVLPIHFPNAFLGMVRTLLWGDVGERRIDLRASGEVLASQDLGCLRPWGSGFREDAVEIFVSEETSLVGELLEAVELEH